MVFFFPIDLEIDILLPLQVLYLLGKEKDAEALIQESIRILEVHDYVTQNYCWLWFFSYLRLKRYWSVCHASFDYTGKWPRGFNYMRKEIAISCWGVTFSHGPFLLMYIIFLHDNIYNWRFWLIILYNVPLRI